MALEKGKGIGTCVEKIQAINSGDGEPVTGKANDIVDTIPGKPAIRFEVLKKWISIVAIQSAGSPDPKKAVIILRQTFHFIRRESIIKIVILEIGIYRLTLAFWNDKEEKQ